MNLGREKKKDIRFLFDSRLEFDEVLFVYFVNRLNRDKDKAFRSAQTDQSSWRDTYLFMKLYMQHTVVVSTDKSNFGSMDQLAQSAKFNFLKSHFNHN